MSGLSRKQSTPQKIKVLIKLIDLDNMKVFNNQDIMYTYHDVFFSESQQYNSFKFFADCCWRTHLYLVINFAFLLPRCHVALTV